MSHDGVYAVATLMASDDAQTDDRASEGDGEVEGQEAMQPRKCYIFCPQVTGIGFLKSWTIKRQRH